MLVLLYIMDSLRRDFVGCYGDEGALTPNLDRVAASATRFTQAYGAAPWSKPSGAALLTGYLPRALGMRDLLSRLPGGVPTLAERFAESGSRTVAVTANPFISRDFGLLRGFEEVVEGFRPGELPGEMFHFHANHFRRLADGLSVAPDDLVLARSPALHAALLARLPAEGTALALCWSMDTHAPFFVRGSRSYLGNPLERVIPAADPEWLTGGLTPRDLVALYRDMVAYQDESFGHFVGELKARGLWEESLVVVAADHGEAFGEHGVMGHISGLWEEQIAVPLLVKFPRQQAGALCEAPVTLLDILPTVLEVTSLHPGDDSDALDGRSLLNFIAEPQHDRPLLIESPDGWALRYGEWKAIAASDDDEPLLFNLRTDPREQRPLADREMAQAFAAQAQAIRVAADARATRWHASEGPEVDEVVLGRLRDLGYL